MAPRGGRASITIDDLLERLTPGRPLGQAALVSSAPSVVVEFWLALANAAIVCGRHVLAVPSNL
jgi:hypothetical protein